MSIRLTNKMRQDIIQDLLTHRFREEIDALIEKQRAFADLLYMDIYPVTMRTEMESLDEGWLSITNYLTV